MCVKSNVLPGMGGVSQVCLNRAWLLWCVVDVVAVCTPEQFGGGVGVSLLFS